MTDPRLASIMERLSREANVDMHAGVAAPGAGQGKLVSLLRMMALTHRDDLVEVEACLRAGERGRARKITHTLRGVAAMLGAMALYDAVEVVDARLRESLDVEPDDIRESIAEASRRLEQLLEIVGEA